MRHGGWREKAGAESIAYWTLEPRTLCALGVWRQTSPSRIPTPVGMAFTTHRPTGGASPMSDNSPYRLHWKTVPEPWLRSKSPTSADH